MWPGGRETRWQGGQVAWRPGGPAPAKAVAPSLPVINQSYTSHKLVINPVINPVINLPITIEGGNLATLGIIERLEYLNL